MISASAALSIFFWKYTGGYFTHVSGNKECKPIIHRFRTYTGPRLFLFLNIFQAMMISIFMQNDGMSRNLVSHGERSAWFTCIRGINTLRPRQNGRPFADDTFKRIFRTENVGISIKISLKFVPRGPINNIPALVQIMAWRRPGDKPLSEPMMARLPTHICVTWSQWVKWAMT